MHIDEKLSKELYSFYLKVEGILDDNHTSTPEKLRRINKALDIVESKEAETHERI